MIDGSADKCGIKNGDRKKIMRPMSEFTVLSPRSYMSMPTDVIIRYIIGNVVH